MEALFEFKNVCIMIGDRVLYNNINLSIYPGDRYIFLGPNGVGKSLLLELMMLGCCGDVVKRYKGLKVTGEIIDANGNNLLDPNTRRNFAYAQQQEEFYENATVFEEAETACSGAGVVFDESELDRLLKRFGLLEKKKKRIKSNLSFGEGKLIHLICVVMKLKTCPVMLLDEPLNHLSFRNSQEFNRMINDEIRKNPNLAIIMVSHCRAMDFTTKAILYDSDSKNIRITDYSPYNCFADDIGRELGCDT